MPLSSVVCCKCKKVMTGKNVNKLPFTLSVIGGKIRPVCDECLDQRKK